MCLNLGTETVFFSFFWGSDVCDSFMVFRVSAPRYRMLPTETDLNSPPLLPNFPEKVLPIGAVQSKATGGTFSAKETSLVWELTLASSI